MAHQRLTSDRADTLVVAHDTILACLGCHYRSFGGGGHPLSEALGASLLHQTGRHSGLDNQPSHTMRARAREKGEEEVHVVEEKIPPEGAGRARDGSGQQLRAYLSGIHRTTLADGPTRSRRGSSFESLRDAGGSRAGVSPTLRTRGLAAAGWTVERPGSVVQWPRVF